MKTYKVTCQVPEETLHALIKYYEALGVTGFSVNLQAAQPVQSAPTVAERSNSSIEAASAARPIPAPKQQKFHYVGGRKNKGISARDLALQVLNTSPDPIVTCNELRAEFVKHGFAKTSISSPLSTLSHEKKIVHCGEGRWALRTRYVTVTNGAASLNL